jgi:hypothetical protein
LDLPVAELVSRHVGSEGGPAPVPQYLPDLLDRVWNRRTEPGLVFDLELPLEQAADGYPPWTNPPPSKISPCP